MKLSRICIGLTRLTHGYLTRNHQQPTCPNAACNNQTLTITHQTLPHGVPPMEGHQKKIQYPRSRSDIKTLLGRDCEVEKIIKFLKEIEIFEQI